MDAKEFKRRFLPHHKSLYRVAYSLTGDAQDAEDLLQDTYLRLWQKRSLLDNRDVPLSYMVAVMRHIHAEHCRLKRFDMEKAVEAPPDKPDERTPLRMIEAKDEAEKMNQLIEELPEKDRWIIRKLLLEGQSYAEIEQDTGLSQGNIRQIAARTKKKLKERFLALTKTWTR